MAAKIPVPPVLKKKKVYIPLIIVALLFTNSAYRSYKKAHTPPEYETAIVTRGDLTQTVEATGKLESSNDVSLRFELSGTLQAINVREGQTVTTGTILATLRSAELNAAVAQASANLQLKLAGASAQDRSYYEAAVNSAKAAYDQSKVDAVTTIKTAEAARDTARNNLKLAEGGSSSQIVAAAYEDAAAIIISSLSKLDDALTQADNILGIDNQFANESFRNSLSSGNPALVFGAQTMYYTTKQSIAAAHAAGQTIGTTSSQTDIEKALLATEAALSQTNSLLTSVSAVLNNTVPNANLTQSSLDTKKSTIATTRTTITTQYTTSINQRQALSDAKNSYSTYQIALAKAEQDLVDAQITAESNIKIKEAAYLQAQATLSGKVDAPRAVDVASYRAALAQAVASRDRAILRAPGTGTVAKVSKKPGELVTPSDVIVQMISPSYKIVVDIPETDIVKLTNGSSRSTNGLNATAEFTLDAFGEDQVFGGQVSSLDRKSTDIQDVVYYQVTIDVAPGITETFQSGMTANVRIKADTRNNVLYVPQRTVRTREDESGKFVRVLKNGEVKEINVKTGLRGDNSQTEITSGLTEGDVVVINVKEPAK